VSSRASENHAPLPGRASEQTRFPSASERGRQGISARDCTSEQTQLVASVGKIARRRTEEEPSEGVLSSASDDDGGGSQRAICASEQTKIRLRERTDPHWSRASAITLGMRSQIFRCSRRRSAGGDDETRFSFRQIRRRRRHPSEHRCERSEQISHSSKTYVAGVFLAQVDVGDLGRRNQHFAAALVGEREDSIATDCD
jgi:hypothetical protein